MLARLVPATIGVATLALAVAACGGSSSTSSAAGAACDAGTIRAQA